MIQLYRYMFRLLSILVIMTLNVNPCYTVKPCCLTILDIRVCIYKSYTPNLFPTSRFPFGNHNFIFCIYGSICFVYRIIWIILLDSICKWYDNLSFSDWLSVMFSRSIQQMAIFLHYGWVMFHCVCVSLTSSWNNPLLMSIWVVSISWLL